MPASPTYPEAQPGDVEIDSILERIVRDTSTIAVSRSHIAAAVKALEEHGDFEAATVLLRQVDGHLAHFISA